jgi:hypothetical protein
MNKTDNIEVVNGRYIHPRNLIAEVDDKLAHINDFNDISADFDPVGSNTDESDFALPPDLQLVESGTTIDSYDEGTTVEEVLFEQDGVYLTSIGFEFFRYVWFDGLIAFPVQHWTLSGSDGLVPNVSLHSDTKVYGRYVVGT